MYDALVRSTLFGIRNADKVVNTNDKGRILADVGQLTNAAKAAAQLDNALGKGAQAAINAMGSVAENNKALSLASKGARWASQNVNPLLIGAAGYRVLTSDDKETSLKREIWGMSSMFAVESAIRAGFSSDKFASIRASLKSPVARSLLGIAEGVVFVLGSIAGSTFGYKLGEYFYPDKKGSQKQAKLNLEELKANTAKINKNNLTVDKPIETKVEDIDESEFFVLKDGKTLA